MTMGRPKGSGSLYTQELADAICERIAEGEPLRQICREEDMPSWRTVYRWMEERADFASRFAHARTLGFDAIAEECLEIADDTTGDTCMAGSGDNKREVADTEWISRSKLRVETRLKLLAKWDPKRYGDKVTQEHTGQLAIESITRRVVDPSAKP